MSEAFDPSRIEERMVPRYETGARVRVTMVDGKIALRELMINGLKVYEFRNKAEAVDFFMQGISSLRYD